MHVITLLFIIFELVMFIFQGILFLARPQDKPRLFYLILLVLLMCKNTASGLFPDPKIDFIPILTQYILTYGAGFVMASYFPFYFYKAYNIEKIKWHATKGVFVFLHFPFFLLFGITFYLTKNIDIAINVGLAIPAIYGIVLGYLILDGIRFRLKEQIERKEYFEMIAVYLAVIPYASLAFFAYLRISQVKEVLLTNSGFAIITILFLRKHIIQSREEYQMLRTINGNNMEPSSELPPITPEIENSLDEIKLSPREKEVAILILQGHRNQEIADILVISPGTVRTHIEKIYKKAQVNSRKEFSKNFG
ncbi:LuxR family transcriptional regulator [Dyadobacter alkalitolerans]|uniref:LuxR family transcriptional regulator n=1 Tax=Dyadobacter alkalitolerans TaxID=492736 RepID=UPI001B7F8DFD|nr:LuxR family transcriptional regulator [Dyadobacter alkalitolerans]